MTSTRMIILIHCKMEAKLLILRLPQTICITYCHTVLLPQMSVAKKVLSYTGLKNSVSNSSDYPGLDITCGIFGQAQVTFLGVVFMYDRRTLSSRAILKPSRMLEAKYVFRFLLKFQRHSNSGSHPIINSSSLSGDPLLAAVAAAERQFYLHLKQGLAWENRAKSRLKTCQKSLRSQWIKLHSLMPRLTIYLPFQKR